MLNAATRPFDVINYLGAVGGARVYNRRRMGAKLDRTLAALHRRLDAEPDANLALTMGFPARWDPFFKDVMTLEEVCRYPTRGITADLVLAAALISPESAQLCRATFVDHTDRFFRA
ncbi:hypothetical protein [Streptomyces adustus]|uniref:hypothetical protein n=1 Tax=Streptomyces adustus TaxID=1609272 RepID=UPI00192E6456|nr:hypothetical protein [Streptomyces adustus]